MLKSSFGLVKSQGRREGGGGEGGKYPGPGPFKGAHKPGPRRHNNIDHSTKSFRND